MAEIPIVYSPIPAGPSSAISRQPLPEGGIQAGSQFLQGIEGIFDAYNRNKLAEQQRADWQFGHFGMTPQDITQGFNDIMHPKPAYAPPDQPQVAGSLYGSPTQGQQVITGHSIPTEMYGNGAGPAPGVMPPPPMPQIQPTGQPQGMTNQMGPQGTPGSMLGLGGDGLPPNPVPQSVSQGQPGDTPTMSTLRNMLHIQGHTAQLKAAQEEAGLGKTGAEARKLGAEADLTEAQVRALGGSNSLVNNLTEQIKSGKQKYDDLSNLGRGEIANAIRLGVEAKLAREGVNVQGLTNKALAGEAGAKSSATLTEGGASQQMARAANSAYKQFDLLERASDDFARTNSQFVNEPLLKIKVGSSPQAQVLKTALSTARIEYARAASGSNSPAEIFMEEARAALPDGITPAQIKPTLMQLRNSLSEQATGQLTATNLKNVPPVQRQPEQTIKVGRFQVKVH